jgi:hypothetical protein
MLHVRVSQNQQQPHGFTPIAFLELHIDFKDGRRAMGINMHRIVNQVVHKGSLNQLLCKP